ncbi:sulfurtransferase [Bernardetia sp. OM2101]|uniref:sulfurtransferase n=1 Tax=Bernardetia sp. OM2101 TaxID=3344876 RepID=UPI0035CEC35E
MKNLVSVEWLSQNLSNNNIFILDASQSNNKADLKPKFENLKIKNARFFDLKKFSDTTSNLPSMLPSARYFEENCRKLGINKNSQIIVYDNLGIYTSPRVWWMFKAMGHKNIAVLDGGLDVWMENGYETESIITSNETVENNFEANIQSEYIRNIEFIQKNIGTKQEYVIDARSAGRFNGTEEEPRKGLKSGSIPNSFNLPFQNVLQEGKYKSEQELKIIFERLNLQDKPLIFSCGSGITACIILLAAELVLPNQKKTVYDGSWTEWAQKML